MLTHPADRDPAAGDPDALGHSHPDDGQDDSGDGRDQGRRGEDDRQDGQQCRQPEDEGEDGGRAGLGR